MTERPQVVLADVEEAARAATPGGWNKVTRGYADIGQQVGAVLVTLVQNHTNTEMVWIEDDRQVAWVALVGNGPNGENNGQFIATANPDTVQRLCAAIRELVASGPNSIERLAALAVLQRHGIRLDRGDAP